MILPLGFEYASAYAGLRKQQDRDDVALIVAARAVPAAAVFTRNMVQAAPVRLARRHMEKSGGKLRAVLINAGNANCATRTGDKVAAASCAAVAKALQTRPYHVFPASTGVIGVELDPQPLLHSIPALVKNLSAEQSGFEAAAYAMLTTDTRLKVSSDQLRLGNTTVRLAGMTKGSGMIHPNMATTLGFVMTDAAIAPKDLQRILLRAVDRTYNCLSVDGDMSTNDTVALLASGESGPLLSRAELQTFEEALTSALESLARQIAADGEGARKLIVVRAVGFKTEQIARQVARAIANSPLVKTAIAGSDPNWGRILAAAGYSGAIFSADDIDVHLQNQLVCKGGRAADFDEGEMKTKLDSKEVHICVTHRGRNKGEARLFTCDLTEGYIHINGSYRT